MATQKEKPKKSGIERIATERARQIAEEGWTLEHDDQHQDGSLAMAAVCYATPEPVYVRQDSVGGTRYDDPWPWSDSSDRRPRLGNMRLRSALTHAQQIRQLEKAGALLAAEIDRLLRRQARQAQVKKEM